MKKLIILSLIITSCDYKIPNKVLQKWPNDFEQKEWTFIYQDTNNEVQFFKDTIIHMVGDTVWLDKISN